MEPRTPDSASVTRQNPLQQLRAVGQSFWLDFIQRGMFQSGELMKLIDEDGLAGVTSNPSIFEKAIGGTDFYTASIRELALTGLDAVQIYEALAVHDLQTAADLFRPLYDRTRGEDGFVSMEVSPHLAHDTAATLAEARRYWAALNRPNVMIKIPGTREGTPAIRQALSEGININVTLLFGLPRYREVVDAYLSALEERVQQGKPVDRIASVASFFLSRIDVLLDPQLEEIGQAADPSHNGHYTRLAHDLVGEVAVASAKMAYQIYSQEFSGERFRSLQQHGARTQRLLWASTSTKNPNYQDVKYVEALIGPDTVNTMPLETAAAFRDHGRVTASLTKDLKASQYVLASLPQVEIDLDAATQRLEDEGVTKFVTSFDKLVALIERQRIAALSSSPGR